VLARDPDPLEFNHLHAGIRTTDFRKKKLMRMKYETYKTYNLLYQLNVKLMKTEYQIKNIEDPAYSFSVRA